MVQVVLHLIWEMLQVPPGMRSDWYEVASLTYDYVLPDNLDSQDSLYVDFNIYGLTESQVGSFIHSGKLTGI